MILAVDALYDDKTATGQVAGVLFPRWGSLMPSREYLIEVNNVAPYKSGEFYKRELPSILALLDVVSEPVELIIVDGYVDLEPGHAGIGRHLYEHLGQKVPIIGIAKSRFRSAQAAEVRRHGTRPLFVTSAGIPQDEAAKHVLSMVGPNRIPDLLKRVDTLTRQS